MSWCQTSNCELVSSTIEMLNSTNKMECEMKSLLKNFASIEDQLEKEKEKSKKVETELKQVIHILEIKVDTLEKKNQSKQIEVDKLKGKIEGLLKNVDENQHELEVFTRNRDETVSKYEELVKKQGDDLEFRKKEV